MKLTRLFTFTLALFLSNQLVSGQSTATAKTKPTFEATADLARLLETLTSVEPVAFDSLPKNKRGDVNASGYWSLRHPEWPPLPGNFYGLAVWPLGKNYFVLDDRTLDYAALAETDEFGSAQARMFFSSANALVINTNQLWIEIVSVDLTNQLADLLVHTTTNALFYQLQSKSNLLQPTWELRGIQTGTPGTNVTPFLDEPIASNPTLFFRAQSAGWSVAISASDVGVEPNGGNPSQAALFYVTGSAPGVTNNLTLYYRVSGQASNGVDYTALSGVLTLTNAGGSGFQPLKIEPLADALIEGSESVIVTLLPTNTYVIDPAQIAATNFILDAYTTVFITRIADAVEPDGPPRTPAQLGQFTVSRDDLRGVYTNQLLVRYAISGTASNGVDYTNLTGSVTFAAGATDTNIFINPAKDNLSEGLETVTLTLRATNTYLLNDQSNATVTIADSTTTVAVTAIGGDAVEPGGSTAAVNAVFQVQRTDTRGIYTNMSVRYTMSGTASNGLDYSNLTGVVTFAPGELTTNIVIAPLADGVIEGTETVILTLVNNGTNGYLLDTNAASDLVNITDTIIFQPIANVGLPIGIDFYAPSNYLIVSSESSSGFVRIFTNVITTNSLLVTNVVVTNWTGINSLQDETKLATVKTTANGFTNGAVYFGETATSDFAHIGWIEPHGTNFNLNFATLTNELAVRGGLYVDQSGSFGGELIVVTGGGFFDGGGVWRIKTNGVTTKLADLNVHLEGVVTLTNDVSKWGPWAGKIISGAESTTPPKIFSISTNGTVQTFTLGIAPEDFDIIPANQDLYMADGFNNTIVKVARSYFAPFVGDLLITQAGDGGPSSGTPTLFIVHWKSATSSFEVITIPYPDGGIEHVTFAPVNFPPLP